MSQGFVSADGTRFVLPNGYSRQLPHGGGPQGVKTWFFKPDGKIWPGCEGCQCDYTSNFSSCDQCPKALVALSLPPEHVIVSEEKGV